MSPNDLVSVRRKAPQRGETYHEPRCSKVSQRNLSPTTYTTTPRRIAEMGGVRPAHCCHR